MTLDRELEIIELLRKEVKPALGCTEPIAIAYAASVARHALGTQPTSLKAGMSGNIIKNVKSVVVPNTGGLHGMAAAVCAAAPAKKKTSSLPRFLAI